MPQESAFWHESQGSRKVPLRDEVEPPARRHTRSKTILPLEAGSSPWADQGSGSGTSVHNHHSRAIRRFHCMPNKYRRCHPVYTHQP